ncbi:DNA polymerase III subunit delta [Enterovibrio sp. ZSDZ35]|uniref:DNA polymerase III subunit delta n=1 Tax=Enterovibrio qingdaonensis TaxID=2899818 RepID=A0ABT5QR18_9GAMM|nr:DNA polymerase III subunit delta [Enterovibrio sp. ZSDZ35]MDD1783426.1 DNA polymerase III subunit delta [Enterovibrio sp. ZSDZ35]
MRVYPEQLTQRLSQGLCKTYLLFGNEPLLKQESIQNILDEAAKQGFDEKHRFTIDSQLNWQDIYDCCQALSLFANRQVLIITFPENPLTAAQANALKELAPLLHQDVLLVFDGPRLNKKQESAQWFTLFQKEGLYVPCNTPDARQLPRFIENRCHSLGLKPDHESILLLAQWHEGNLLALSQSLMKLQLLYPDGELTLVRLKEALSRHNHYTPFQLTDALIEGKAKRAIRIVRQLEAEGVEITILLRVIQKELVQLCKMQEYGASGMGLSKIFDHFRVWQNRRAPLTAALHRLPLPALMQLLRSLADIETMVKTDFDSQPWPALAAFSLNMCGHTVQLSSVN